MIGIPLLGALVYVAYLAFPWVLIFVGNHLGANPPRPEITYGEFSFRLEYEINRERKVIQDTLICEFDGFGADEGHGKYRKWKKRLASGNERITLLVVNQTQEIYYSPGSPNYYMGDLENNEEHQNGFPNALIIERAGRFTSNRLVRADELLDKYSIKLISWDSDPPIKNTFSK